MINSNWKDRGALPINVGNDQQQQQPAQQKQRSFLMNFIPAITSTIGAVGGGALGALAGGVGAAPGAVGGGAAGGALGEWITQKLSGESDDGVDKGNLVEEAAWGSLPGVGKLLKGANVGSKIFKGAKYADEAAEGANVAGKTGVAGRISSFLNRTADDAALKSAGVSGKASGLAGFKQRFGEDLGTFMRKNNLIGKSPEEIQSGLIKNLGKQYSDEVGKIGRNISSSDVLAQNEKYLTKLLNSSSTDKKKLGQQVFDELAQIFEKADNITPSELNAIKSEYQTLARNAYKLGADPARTGVNKEVATVLKKTLQGVSGSDDLLKLGKESDKAYKALDLISKGAEKGRGTNLFRLRDIGFGGAGAILGGVPGAAGGIAFERALDNPKVLGFIARQLAAGGEKFAGKAASNAVKTAAKTAGGELAGMGAKDIAKRSAKVLIPKSIIQGSMNAQPPQGQEGEQPAPQSVGAFDPTGAEQDAQNLAQIMAVDQGLGGGGNSVYSQENLMADIQRDPKNAGDYMAIYEMLNPETQQDPLTLSDSAIGKTTDVEKALQGLNELESIVGSGFAGGVVQGNLRKFNPFDSSFKSQQASIDRVRQIVGKALEGGVLRKEDEEKYKKILPTMQDNPDVAMSKIQQLRAMMQGDLQNYLSLQTQYGKGSNQTSSSDLQSILGAGSSPY